MATRPILLYPSPVIRKMSAPVTSIDERLQRLIDDMIETMYAAPGIGLAAPQVGALTRVIVLDPRDQRRAGGLITLINPETIAAEGTTAKEEGCLCIPGVREEVTRSERVVVRAYDRNEREIVVEGSGLRARILQHEIDHLDGVLFIDRLGTAKREMISRVITSSSRRSPSTSGPGATP